MAGPISTRAVKRSTTVGIIVCAVFAVLLVRILMIQTVNFEEYQEKVINQLTTESPILADRGEIYDRNGVALAANVTTYRLFISPSSIKAASELEDARGDTKNYAEIIALGLSEITGADAQEIYTQATKYTQYLDRTIMRKVDEETADKVSAFINEEKLSTMVYLEAQSTRYYPSGSLAAHAIGFTSSDGVGLYGIELQYDEYLKGVDGYYINARDAYGQIMPSEYASRIEAIHGYHVTSTIDATVQALLEEQVEKTAAEHGAKNRACGIVMEVDTGAVLGMATSSAFDLNDPWALSDDQKAILEASGYAEGTDEYDKLVTYLLTSSWSNKAVSESYIPGSTFKIISSSIALEEKLFSVEDRVSCYGYKVLFGTRVRCHKIEGHGSLTFEQGLQQSCNVWFMTIGEKIGIPNFKKYVNAFGYMEKTGIDLPGEGTGIFNANMGEMDLAIYAFGQNFNVTPLQQITAVASVANGGKLVTPYIVEKITDPESGNVIYKHETEVKRQTVSADVCAEISRILEEGVSGNGGAKNAYVAGYRVAAKTGTSEKKDDPIASLEKLGIDPDIFYPNGVAEDRYICSTVAYAPADDPKYAIIIIVDEPSDHSPYGSTVAAPYVSDALENILPHLGVEAKYTEAELKKMAVSVGSYKNWSVSYAKQSIEERGLECIVVGEGDVVKSQSPAYGTMIEKASGKVILYTGSSAAAKDVEVPNFVGMTATQANGLIMALDLNIKIEGTNNYLTGTEARVYAQSVEAGTKVSRGEVIKLTFRYEDADDDPDFMD